MSLRNNDFFNTGYTAADDNNPTTLYLSIQGNGGSPIGTRFKVYRMVGADTGIFDTPTNDSNITGVTKHLNGQLIERILSCHTLTPNKFDIIKSNRHVLLHYYCLSLELLA